MSATATITSSSTAIELEAVPQNNAHNTFRDVRHVSSRGAPEPELDPILEASRLADSSVPDGGYGWVVISACSVLTWWTVGFSYCWGVLLAALVQDGVSTPATLSFVGSLCSALISAFAIATSRLLRVLGVQKTCLIGVSFMGVANILSSFVAQSVAGLFVTSGVLMGLGSSLCFVSVSVIPPQYFNRKRGLANGIVLAGGGIGGAVMSIAINAFIQRFGIPWTYRLVGLGILTTGLPAAWLVKERVPPRTAGFVEWRLLKDPKFLLVFAAGAVGIFPLFVPPFFLPLYCRTLGLSSTTGAGLVAGFTFASGVGRLLWGMSCDIVGPLNMLILAFVLNAISLLTIWPVSNSLAPLAAFAIINGLSNGGFFATMPTVVGNVFGSERVATAMGMVITGFLGGYLMGAPIAGYLLAAYGGENSGLQAYRPAMFYAGSLALGAAGLALALRLKVSRKFLKKL